MVPHGRRHGCTTGWKHSTMPASSPAGCCQRTHWTKCSVFLNGQVRAAPCPRNTRWPVPTLMIAGGVVLGVFLAITGKFIAGAGARLRAAAARKKLNSAVAAVADRLVVEPVDVEVRRLKSFNAALKSAGRI